MKLQVKDAGAWRNVVEFDAARMAEVEAAAAALLLVAGGLRIAMRITDGDLVMAYCEKPTCEWRAK
jgi:hypothetical protein